MSREHVRSITRLTRSHAPHCLLRSRAPLSSFTHSLNRSHAYGKGVYVFEKMRQFHSVSTHGVMCALVIAVKLAADASGYAISLIPATRLCACMCVCAHACVFLRVAIPRLMLR